MPLPIRVAPSCRARRSWYLANHATNAKVGQNSNVGYGSLSVINLYEPRQVTLSVHLRF